VEKVISRIPSKNRRAGRPYTTVIPTPPGFPWVSGQCGLFAKSTAYTSTLSYSVFEIRFATLKIIKRRSKGRFRLASFIDQHHVASVFGEISNTGRHK
jgi:hypothetical protein